MHDNRRFILSLVRITRTMDPMQKKGLNNAHLAQGVLRWCQLQHTILHNMHTFVSAISPRRQTEKKLLSKDQKELHSKSTNLFCVLITTTPTVNNLCFSGGRSSLVVVDLNSPPVPRKFLIWATCTLAHSRVAYCIVCLWINRLVRAT